MYQLYLMLCVVSGVVFGDSHEAKYIDLIPEEEKQEFLNRIARRIIEEIQTKDTPEQSHVEVSEDQLNEHNAYVRDIIKEESENMRNERDTNEENNKGETNSKKDKEEVEYNDRNYNENNQHIDLTLRSDKHNETTKQNHVGDSKINVIPVQVIYDQNDPKSTQSSTVNPKQLDELTSINSNTTEKKYYKDSNNQSENASTTAVKFLEEKDKSNENKTKNLRSQVKQRLRNSLVGNLTESQLSAESTLTKVSRSSTTTTTAKSRSSNNDHLFEITEASIKNDVGSDKQILKGNNQTQTDADNGHKTLVSFSKLDNTKSVSKKSDYNSQFLPTHTPRIVTTTTENSNNQNGIEYRSELLNSTEKKVNTDAKINVAKKYLRTRADTLSDEDKFQNEGSIQRYSEPKRIKNKAKQYIVYEVPDEKPIFIQKENSKEQEEPHVVPVYNFAPKNAYYNGYNHFGTNNEQEAEGPHTNVVNNNEDILDNNSFLRGGFEIDLKPNNIKNRNDKNALHKNYMDRSHQPRWTYHFKHNTRGNIKQGTRLKQLGRYDSNKQRLKYVPFTQDIGVGLDDNLTKQKRLHKIKYGRQLPSSNEEDHPYNSLQKYTNHIRAVQNLFYQHQKFGLMAPPNYESKLMSHRKRVFDGGYVFGSDNDDRRANMTPKTENIALDYYFGRYKSADRTDNEYFDDFYVDLDEIKPIRHQLNHFTNKHDNLNMIYNRNKNCEHGCVETDSKPKLDFEINLETAINIIKDMIYRDKKELVSYDWLMSSVDMESAVKKLMNLIKNIENGNQIHYSDQRLLYYIVYLYNTSKNILDNTIHSKIEANALQDICYILNNFFNLLRRRISLPKNKKHYHMNKGDAVRLWYRYYLRGFQIDDYMQSINAKVLRSFKIFLQDLEDNMFELHNALKHIASITTYRNQNWYADLKNIYFKNAPRKQLLQVILHLAASRLFESMENTAKDAEKDVLYIKKNEVNVRRIQDDFIFVLRILEKMKKIS